ncbi:MAG: tyrosine-type recombinase/integrase [Solibacillus sp.]
MSWARQYLHHLYLEGKTENTIDTYRYHLIAFSEWLDARKTELSELKPADLLSFKEYLLVKKKSERTVNCIISCIKCYFDYLILNEMVESNPVSSLLRIKVPDYRQSRLTDEQLVHFYHFIDKLQPNVRATFYLLLGSGARLSEITSLTKSDFKFEADHRLSITISDAKYGSDRIIPVLHVKAICVLHDYLDSVDVCSLPAFRVSKRTVQRHAANFSERTGIPFSCHVLRHTYATLLLEKGVPIEKIQYLLGHKSVNITRHYTQSAFLNANDLVPTL